MALKLDTQRKLFIRVSASAVLIFIVYDQFGSMSKELFATLLICGFFLAVTFKGPIFLIMKSFWNALRNGRGHD